MANTSLLRGDRTTTAGVIEASQQYTLTLEPESFEQIKSGTRRMRVGLFHDHCRLRVGKRLYLEPKDDMRKLLIVKITGRVTFQSFEELEVKIIRS